MENFNEEYTSDKPHAYGGKYRAYEYYRNIDKNRIEDAFKTSDIYSRFKQHKKSKTYSPIYVRKKRELFQHKMVLKVIKEECINKKQLLTNIKHSIIIERHLRNKVYVKSKDDHF